MSTATTTDLEPNQLSVEENYALAILTNISTDQLSQLKQTMDLDSASVVDPQTLKAFLQFCESQGLPLSVAGVNSFKDEHHLGNTGAAQGVIGPQTAGVYYQVLMAAVAPPTATVAPAGGDLNAAIVAAAETLREMCTADGPDGGNNACAWSVNRVLKQAGITPPLGENPNYVPSLVEALEGGRGQRIDDPSQIKAGDLVVAAENAHIGVALEDGSATRVLSNSSSKASFRWESDLHYDDAYGGTSTVYRLLH